MASVSFSYLLSPSLLLPLKLIVKGHFKAQQILCITITDDDDVVDDDGHCDR